MAKDLSSFLHTSHHAMWDKCLYWKRTEVPDEDLDKIMHDLEPKGFFYARPFNDFTQDDQSISSFVFESNEVAIETNDDIYDTLKTKDLVLFCDRLWNVTSIVRKVYQKQRQFSNSVVYTCVISLKR